MNIKMMFAALLMMMSMPLSAEKYAGGDISLLSRYEENGAKYYDKGGNAVTDVLNFFKNEGWNAMRVRLFVDPSQATDTEKGEGVCQDLEYVVALSKKIKAAGFKLMLDFHYSDSWADPAKQWTPAAWQGKTDEEMYSQIYDYTKQCLQTLVDAGVTPDLIQTGNEISYGMLWGKKTDSSSALRKCYINNTSNWDYFTTLLSRASKACREVCPNAKVILHTERVAQTSVLTNFYDQMATYGVDYDVIGVSYYPYYHGDLATLESAINTLESKYSDKEIMVVETGYYHNWQPSSVTYDYSSTYAISDDGQLAFTNALIDMLNTHKSVTGLFWWWPEANEYGLDWNTKRVTDNWYNAGLFDNETGKARQALSVIKNFLTSEDTHINSLSASNDTDRWYNLSGYPVEKPNGKGVFIKGKKKIICD